MRVGVFAVSDPGGGGIYQYSLMVLQAMEDLRGRLEPVIVHDRAPRSAVLAWQAAGWQVVSFRPRTVRTIARAVVAAGLGKSGANRIGRMVRTVSAPFGRRWAPEPAAAEVSSQSSAPFRVGVPRDAPAGAYGLAAEARPRAGAWLRARGIQLMVYPAPVPQAYECGVPYVMAVHDLQHRLQPEFPEVSAKGEWESREQLFTNGIRSAVAILVDSEVGREDVLAYYGHLVSPDRVRVLPYVLPPYLQRPGTGEVEGALRALRISGRYLLFPAQFWPHKNHRRVAEAIALLHRRGADVQVVMTGSAGDELRARTLAEIREIVEREGIDHQVRILGYVDDRTIAALYAGAAGMILPTFFGPTNIPVIEAWAIGVPVLTSDIRGIREQCGDAAILVDPRSTEAIAEGMRRLCWDDTMRERLVAAGRVRLARSDAGQFRDTLGSILRDAAESLERPEPLGRHQSAGISA